MNEICRKDKCTGCSACFNVCHHEAITMTEDACGYIYPKVNKSFCVDCGLCTKVCPVINNVPLRYPTDCYAATIKDKIELETCASGGIATGLARYVIEKGGIVYGCSGKDIRNVHHIRIVRAEDLDLLKGSKYVQSSIGRTFKNVKKDLHNEKFVLFIGTPCQVAGLQRFLRNDDCKNLLTIDLVCHGVPSQKMLKDNIALYSDNDNISVWFRKKGDSSSIINKKKRISYGWFYKTDHMRSARGIRYYKDPYMFGFLTSLTFRNSCYNCRYANISRCGDFTLGDFWGLAKDAGFVNGNGVSVVFVNTKKSMDIWADVSKRFVSVRRDVVEALKGNGQLQAPSRKHHNYDKFMSLYPNIGFKMAVYSCLKKDLVKIKLRNVKMFVKNMMKVCFC